MNWYYAEAGRQAGPVSEAEFSNLVSTGRIQPDTLVWKEGMANWEPYGAVKTVAASSAPSNDPLQTTAVHPTSSASGADVVCAECGKLFSRDNAIPYGTAWICAACKPIFIQKFKEGATLPGAVAVEYAGFWIRVLAKMIDGLIFGLILGIPFVFLMLRSMRSGPPSTDLGAAIGVQLLFQFLSIAVTVGYNTFFLGKFGATVGKMACKLKVVTAEGAPVSYLRAFGRAWAEQLSGLVCYIGYIIVAFDSEKRALHDHICKTRVIRK